jgi:hypothetical protein
VAAPRAIRGATTTSHALELLETSGSRSWPWPDAAPRRGSSCRRRCGSGRRGSRRAHRPRPPRRAHRGAARGGAPRAPVEPATGRVGGARERRAEHHGIRTARDGLDEVTAGADTAVGDDVDVASAGLVEVVAPGRGDVGDGRGHRGVDAQGAPRRVGRAATEADEHAGRAGAHEVQGRGVGGRPTDDDRHVELVDEPLEVERLGAPRDVLGRDGGATDDEQVDPGIHDGLPQLLGALGGQRPGDRDPGIRISRSRSRSRGRGRCRRGRSPASGSSRPRGRGWRSPPAAARVLVARPQPLEVEHRQPTETAEGDRARR